MLMSTRLSGSLFLILVLQFLSPGMSRAETKEENGYLSPSELFAVMDKSEQTYELQDAEALGDLKAEDYASVYWPSNEGGVQFPWIELDGHGGRSLSGYDLGEGCVSILAKAEPHFDAKNYEKSRKLYLKATNKFPKCYLAYASLGDTYYFNGNALEALPWYLKSIELNPYDFRGYFYKANALHALARFDEARAAYLTALAMKPHRESITGAIKERLADIGAEFIDSPFTPRALARQEKDKIVIYTSADTPYWMVYGMCKAVWIGEPAHREARTGDREYSWSLQEERQCLFSMLESYYASREEGELESDPEMERIFAVAKDDLIDGFILYEIVYQIHGDFLILYPDSLRDEVLKYVTLHVLPARSAD